MSIITLLLSICTNCWGESGLEGKPLERWGYALIESLKSDTERKYLDNAVQSLNVLSITGYKVGRDGQLHAPSAEQQRGIASLAGKSALNILPLVTLTSSSEGRKLLASESSRQRAIANLAALAQDGLYAGLHLDFEYLPPEDAPKLAAFLKVLRSKLNGKKLTMAVFPPVDFPENWSGFHDLKLIGLHLDEIVLMCYDYHRPGTEAGPVVDLEWAKRNIAQVLKSIRPEKVWLGMPAYGYDWPKNGKPKVVSAREGVKLAAQHNAVRDASGTLHFQYTQHGETHEVYLADLETRKCMEDLAKSFGLKGVALWRLGFEEGSTSTSE
jgi:spore germination protein YaaH